ncbi:DEAD/DEAH box helicase [Bacteroides sp. 224]|uniref:DEAD/DEAH box helicase n=1 Tax=Bacteroides sp. 224 TaxID=2302936 RepID=UPI0013D58853|nr:DEAD/DEAH box helicase [Bacteroides sp. 224]NDV64720.1 ATP-dependent helicase [Bacteroides sp. 224]
MTLKKTTKGSKKSFPKSILTSKPHNMTLPEWQIALRKYAAEKELFAISFSNRKLYPGDYSVINPITKHTYKVVYRGNEEWNYCSCMDFKTNQLGTCKHIEAVKLWLEEHNLGIPGEQLPAYTSMYLSYKGERRIKIRIGSEHKEEFEKIADTYFTPDGEFPIENFHLFSNLLNDVAPFNSSFRCYDDAFSYIIEHRENTLRHQMLRAKYSSEEKVDGLLKTTLYPYQRKGILFAAKTGKCIIADEMGLGKTIQAIGTAELLKKEQLVQSVLILCPTSLKYQWKSEIERFTNSDAVVIEGNHIQRKKLYRSAPFYKIVSYNSACNDLKLMSSLHTDMLIMDEAQRLKNWKTQIARATKRITSDYTVVLSGTPLENKLEELYSITQYVDQYCLGPFYEFMNRYTLSSESGRRSGYQHLNEIGKRLENVLLRRKKKEVALQLPERIDKILFMPMTPEQREMHDEYQTIVSQLVHKWHRMKFLSEKDRNRLLLSLNLMRMVCDSTFIINQQKRYDTKIDELMNIISNVVESGEEKIVVFSQWERMARLVAQELDKKNIRYEFLHGGVPSPKRKALMENFTNDPESRVFISTDAGSTGLNLQVASILVNLDLPWNPAVLEQRIARIHRIGQRSSIQVLNFVAKDTIEERMLSTLNFKSALFEGILDNGADSVFLEESKFDKLMHVVEDLTESPSAETPAKEKAILEMDDMEMPEEAKQPVADKEKETIQAVNEGATTTVATDSSAASPQQLIAQGMNFFSELSQTLSSPEKTQQLVSSIIEEDKETGQTVLKIPVKDKDTVMNVFNLLGKLLNQNK